MADSGNETIRNYVAFISFVAELLRSGDDCAKDLLRVVKTKKTELLFLALFLRLLKPGGRAAVIVPDGVLFGSKGSQGEAAAA